MCVNIVFLFDVCTTDNCRDDVVSHCQLSVQLMKLFPDTVLEFGVSAVNCTAWQFF